MSAAQYIERYQALTDSLPGQHLPWLNVMRQVALGAFAASGFPSPRSEEWKYTNVSALEKKRFQPLVAPKYNLVDAAWLAAQTLPDAWTLVLVDGRYYARLSDTVGLPNSAIITGLSEAFLHQPDEVKTLFGAALPSDLHGFLAFNTAYFSDGAFVHIPAGVALAKPLQILHVSTCNDALINTRSLVSLGANAEAKIIETFVGVSDSSYLTADVAEVVLGNNAALEHYKVQIESDKSYHFGGLYVTQSASSKLCQHNMAFGGLLSRGEIHATLGNGAECELNGLFLGKDRQHVDNHFIIDHSESHGASRETYRGVLADRSRGVFQGRIVVHPQAQKTSAQMNSRNLLLSDDAEVDAKPQLEILADDVKCSHGVAIGQLDPESVFYLVSRGVDPETARNMLTFAFANEMVEKIGLQSLRERVQGHLLDRFPQTGIRRDWL
ncbi:MAG: Fe-S cluster assembly protein SufD [Candidatus Methylumidiphilus sp.]